MYIHTRSIHNKVFDVWNSPGRFTKNPDVVRLESGRMLLIYSDNDGHWSQEDQILTILASDNDGADWFRLSEVDKAELRNGDERLVTPRLSALSDGSLAVAIDRNDYRHFHEDQEPGILIYWSSDGGESWSEPKICGIEGFEPDRMMELPDGSLAVCSHVMLRESQEFAEIITISEDRGKTWKRRAVIAHNGYHRFCEGALVVMNQGKKLACIIRENHSAGIPSLAAFSDDNGFTWTEPRYCPFAFHRPYAKQLKDGRVLVTGRNMNGGLGTYAWAGDIEKELDNWYPAGPRLDFDVHLSDKYLKIQNLVNHECRYSLLPPESGMSEVHFEAEVRVESPYDDIPIAFLSLNTHKQLALKISNKGLSMGSGTDQFTNIDMTQWRTIGIHHRGGLLTVKVDNNIAMEGTVYWEPEKIQDFNRKNAMNARTQFGQASDFGRSWWRRIKYSVKNKNLPSTNWEWKPENGWPDAYGRERFIQIHSNALSTISDTSVLVKGPDHGYSSWVELPNGQIFLVDYTNLGDQPGKSHLVGIYIDEKDYK